MSASTLRLVVLGAGAIGAYVGGSLRAQGVTVTLVSRGRMHDRIASHGIHLTGLNGVDQRFAASDFEHLHAGERDAIRRAVERADLVLVTVKAHDLTAVADRLADCVPPSALVCCFQNGIAPEQALRAALPGARVVAGVVPFNVAVLPAGRLHRATSGDLIVQAGEAWAPWRRAFRTAHLPLLERDDMHAVQWGKLLLNLNNAVNALSGLPLKAQLERAEYRRVTAALIDEALGVLNAARVQPARVGRLPPRLLPKALRLPDVLFRRLAAGMLRVDPEARSSMWDDLEAGRVTEVDGLNGAVVELADRVGAGAPLNRAMRDLVHAVERGASRVWTADALWSNLRRSL